MAVEPATLPPITDAAAATAPSFQFERGAAVISVVVSVVLLAIKFAAYWFTGSAAIFSDAMESIVNVLGSGFALYSVILAHAPADEKHPYGHGKVEFMSAGLEGGMMLLAAVWIAYEAVQEMIRGPEVHQVNIGLLLLLLAGAVNGGVGLFLIRSGRRHGSLALVADGKHLLSDAVTSGGVIAALALMWLRPNWTWVDPIAAILVACYVAWIATDLLRGSAAGLMDQQDVDDERMLTALLDAHVGPIGGEPRICSYHKLRHRHSGRYHWVEFHLVVPASWDVARGHEVASKLEREIELALGEGDATAHVEPCKNGECGVCGPRRAKHQ
jgi:cation diffusion facilitator family transporter